MTAAKTLTLAEFLLARIAEDEGLARAAIEPENMYPYGDRSLPRLSVEQVPDALRGYLGGEWGEHAAQHDPARVLAECDAKRQIVELHAPDEDPVNFEEWNHAERAMRRWRGTACSRCGHIDQNPVAYPCDTLRLLALPYAEHEDYHEEWRALDTDD